ncbi:glycosyltransferase [Niveispirillum sp. SYP-B3756]|uniref:glycosyltransferase family 4 protein n=1 Tax=Niveispirillum sp. SYP-B3756 TaxID=2662178 RepID=UPI00129164E9|nr:glycosyltransferase family 4 protein [Niveispirillum sp. SYP-B3756]MQP68455.1 glycosyltransferase [Niveispirillum sp. SYP-B3756]
MKVAFLWTGLSGYTNACLKELAARPGVELLVACMRPQPDAPFNMADFAWISRQYCYDREPDAAHLQQMLEEFQPDLLIFNSWHIPAFRQIAKLWRGRVPRVMGMDNQWLDRPKQYLGWLTRSFYIAPIADFAFLPGDRQAKLARRLGFAQDRILYGMNSADVDAFNLARPSPLPASFVYVGRLDVTKGILPLLESYALYRQKAGPAAWPLVLCGTGPLLDRVKGREGVEVLDFVQPAALPGVLSAQGCAIQPSLVEPWGVSIHEATAAGLPVICTYACGAVAHLVQDGYNGFIVDAGNIRQMADAMRRYAALLVADRERMGEASLLLSRQFTPARWADTLLGVPERFKHRLEA